MVLRSQAKTDDNFADYFFKTKTENVHFKMLIVRTKCKIKKPGAQKTNLNQ